MKFKIYKKLKFNELIKMKIQCELRGISVWIKKGKRIFIIQIQFILQKINSSFKN